MRLVASRSVTAAILFASTLSGCFTTGGSPSLPPLQIREFQTRTYDTTDTATVLKALLNVLQDDGFVVGTVNTDIGLITASKESTERRWVLIFAKDVTSTWTCSVNVTPFGQQTKVRANVQFRQKWWPEGNERAAAIDDPSYYQTFFAKVDKGIFIQKERL